MSDQPLTYVNEQGQRVGLGCLPRETAFGELPCVGAWDSDIVACPTVQRNEWQEQPSLEWAEKDDIFQNGYPSCCLCAIANGVEFHLSKSGRTFVTLDWHKAWVECTGGNGGYAIDSGLRYAMTKGFPIKGSAERIHVVEAWDIPDATAFASALQRGDSVVFGWRFPRGPHAECALTLQKQNGEWAPEVRNTHGKSYGVRGYHRISLDRQIAPDIRTFGAFAIREVELRAADAADIPDANGVT